MAKKRKRKRSTGSFFGNSKKAVATVSYSKLIQSLEPQLLTRLFSLALECGVSVSLFPTHAKSAIGVSVYVDGDRDVLYASSKVDLTRCIGKITDRCEQLLREEELDPDDEFGFMDEVDF